MASSKSSSSRTAFDVFLSFRGPDTRQGFVDVLYHALTDAGIRVFRDVEELRVGEDIGDEILRAIAESRIFVPIFSRGYASSKWCLMELCKMLESKEASSGKVILPVLYDVGFDDVKLKTELYAGALSKHEKVVGLDRVQQWEEALRKAAEIKGFELKDAGYAEFAKSLVGKISTELKMKGQFVTEHLVQSCDELVGMQDQVEKLKKVLDVESHGVLFVGIHGIGGIGKTTLATAIFDQLSSRYEGCSFLRDIRETSKHKGLKYLRHQLLSDITCSGPDCETSTTSYAFLEKKVLIVLDDVDEREQIKKLVGKCNRFASGSRIIITTRDINVLAVEREIIDGRILEWPREVQSFKMKRMKSAEALQLFCQHAFRKVHPPDGYRTTCKKVISAVGNLPLTIEIIGSFLCQKPIDVWRRTLERLKKLPYRRFHTTLMVSYEALDHKAKEIFLDIACFFSGREKTAPIYMWDACELHPECGIEVLVLFSFIKVLADSRLWMHDEVREFGRKIVSGATIANYANSSRLWVHEEVLDILRSKQVNENVQGLRLLFDEFLQDYSFPSEELGGLPNLRFLELLGFPSAMKRALPKLRWLSWHFCPEHVKVSDLYLENLVILDLSNSNVSDQLGEPAQLEMAKHLKILDLTNCKKITRTPIFSDCMILERLILEGCENLVKIDSSIGNLKSLIYLNLNGCYFLGELPKELGSATALKELVMKGKGQPFKLQDSLVSLTFLSVLEIDNVEIVDSMHTGNSKRLEHLILSKCSGIKKLTESGQVFPLLVKLDLSGSKITRLPDSIGEMKNLKVINMESSLISELPKSIGNVEKLEELHAKNCKGLQGEIPSEIGSLSSLRILDLSFTRISSLPSTLSQLSNLQTLNLECCDELEKLPELPNSLISLFIKSEKLQSLPDLSMMSNLRDLQLSCPIDNSQVDCVRKLTRLEKMELCIPRITILELDGTSRLTSLSVSCCEIEALAQLPSTLSRLYLAHLKKNTKLPSLCNLSSLISIKFYNCSIGGDEFESLGAMNLESLEHFSASKCDFSSDNGLPLPEGMRVFLLKECKIPRFLDLQNLKHLMHLELTDCQLLTQIRGLEMLECLEEIIICKCNSLESLGDLSYLKKLEALQIDSCEMLREVKGLETMTSLKHLEILHCKLLKSSPHRLKRRCESLSDSAPRERRDYRLSKLIKNCLSI